VRGHRRARRTVAPTLRSVNRMRRLRPVTRRPLGLPRAACSPMRSPGFYERVGSLPPADLGGNPCRRYGPAGVERVTFTKRSQQVVPLTTRNHEGDDGGAAAGERPTVTNPEQTRGCGCDCCAPTQRFWEEDIPSSRSCATPPGRGLEDPRKAGRPRRGAGSPRRVLPPRQTSEGGPPMPPRPFGCRRPRRLATSSRKPRPRRDDRPGPLWGRGSLGGQRRG
jgi:hypothetical protein